MNRLKYSITTIAAALSLAFSSSSFAGDETYTLYKRLISKLHDDTAIVDFIEENNYLSDRLLKKWLAYLAKKKRWQTYATYYQPTTNTTRQCHYLQALYETDNINEAFQQIKPLWLKGHKQPKACAFIFSQWQQSKHFSNELLWQRIHLAMKTKQYAFARQLSHGLKPDDKQLVSQWVKLVKQPNKLKYAELPTHPYTPDIVVHVLRRLVYTNMNEAIRYWENNKDNYDFNDPHKQAVYQKLALYMAIRNHPNSEEYFSKLHPETTPDLYHEWRLRAALKEKRWQDVNNIIKFLPTHLHQKSCWQYWYARSYDKLGQSEKADLIYAKLSEKRHYYGFLASHRGGHSMNMDHQDYPHQPELLEPHQIQLDYINSLYKSKRIDKASLLSYELSNNLSKPAQYQLAKHYATWQWHDKALMLANLSEYKNDLYLRFPLAHYNLIVKYAAKYKIPEAFVYAIIRQESTFRKQVKSSAGALGLMQVIPSTARKVSKKYKIPLYSMKSMYQPKTNINIGVAYLNQLSKRFDNHPILMAAAYNAGPQQVMRWLKKPNKVETDLWIETLPWHETRNYLKNVMSFHAVYQHRLNDSPSLDDFMKKI